VSRSLRTGFDAVITRALNENRIVGTAVLIARDGGLAYQHVAGLADREAGKDITPLSFSTVATDVRTYEPVE
jgi:CubicO group peptidase (beta-lactamase class C family)